MASWCPASRGDDSKQVTMCTSYNSACPNPLETQWLLLCFRPPFLPGKHLLWLFLNKNLQGGSSGKCSSFSLADLTLRKSPRPREMGKEERRKREESRVRRPGSNLPDNQTGVGLQVS